MQRMEVDSSLVRNSDQPYGQGARVIVVDDDYEHCGLTWVKLILLIFLTYGLIVAMWFIRYKMI